MIQRVLLFCRAYRPPLRRVEGMVYWFQSRRLFFLLFCIWRRLFCACWFMFVCVRGYLQRSRCVKNWRVGQGVGGWSWWWWCSVAAACGNRGVGGGGGGVGGRGSGGVGIGVGDNDGCVGSWWLSHRC